MTDRSLNSIAAGAAAIAITGGFFAPSVLAEAWHFSVLACLQPALGSIFILLMSRVTGGGWAAPVAPCLTAGARLGKWCFAALAPVLAFLPCVYRWADHPAEVGDRSIFLNWPFFAIRVGFYLLAFGVLAHHKAIHRRYPAGGLVLFALVGYFVAVDLVMALDPEWYSSGFPVVFMASGVLTAMALSIVVTTGSSGSASVDPKVWRDLGNLLMAMTMFWSYVAFTQFLIIWMGDRGEEIGWYVKRGTGIWSWVCVLLAVFNLFVPFLILLSRAVKDRPERLRRIALVVLISQIIYLYWLVTPSFSHRNAGGVHWLDPVALTAAGTTFASLIRIQLRRNRHEHAQPTG